MTGVELVLKYKVKNRQTTPREWPMTAINAQGEIDEQ
jgi:hypothetical protein